MNGPENLVYMIRSQGNNIPSLFPFKQGIATAKICVIPSPEQLVQEIDAYHDYTPRVYVADTTKLFSQEFKRLLAEWKEQATFLSSATQMAMLPQYQQIIGMGKPAIPLILNELKDRPTHLFWALKAISGMDPVPAKDRGHIDKMIKAWIKWGRQKNYIK
jgi:hypothetical protein